MTTFAEVDDKGDPIGKPKVCLYNSLLKVQYNDSRQNCKILSKCVCLRKVLVFILFHLNWPDFLIRFHERLVYIETASSDNTHIPNNFTIISLDAVSMYTNISWNTFKKKIFPTLKDRSQKNFIIMLFTKLIASNVIKNILDARSVKNKENKTALAEHATSYKHSLILKIQKF